MSFETAIEQVLRLEGGYVNDRDDRGGETNFGITIAVARIYGYIGPMKDLPLETAKMIYKKKYWDLLHLDAVNDVSDEIASDLFDCAVNCGPSTACKWLQAALSALTEDIADADGIMGPHTLMALSHLRPADYLAVVKLIGVQRGAHYLMLTQKIPSQKRFIRGWMTRVKIS